MSEVDPASGERRVAIVTGGASGIGLATASLLRDQGVAVAVFDRAGDDPVDITDVDAIAGRVASVRSSLGPVDILVNAAGIAAGGRLEDDGYVDIWEQTLAVNLTGAMHMVRACLSDLLASGHGRIVNVASTEGLGASPSARALHRVQARPGRAHPLARGGPRSAGRDRPTACARARRSRA